MLPAIRLSTRKILEVRGKETRPFLQALLTKDINEIDKTGIVYSFLLNAKGRIFADLFVYKQNHENFLIEADMILEDHLKRQLEMYRVRRKVDISPINLEVYYSYEPQSHSFQDPRVPSFGYRSLGKQPSSSDDINLYHKKRLEFGIPEGADELQSEIPLTANGDLMNGISFDKGCYVGQELIARTHHTGVIRRRVVPFRTPEEIAGTLLDDQGKKQGRVLKCVDNVGIALISLDFIGKPIFSIEKKVPIELYKPEWWPSDLDKREES